MQGLGKGKGGSIRQKPKERKEYGVQALINLRKALDPNQMLIPKAVFERTLRLAIFISFQYFYHFLPFFTIFTIFTIFTSITTFTTTSYIQGSPDCCCEKGKNECKAENPWVSA